MFKFYHFACNAPLLELRFGYFLVNSVTISCFGSPIKNTTFKNPKPERFGLKAPTLNKL